MHRLDGAYERVNGARERLDELRPEISAFTDAVANNVSMKYEKKVITVNKRKVNVPVGTASFPINRPSPPRLRRLIGEVVSNLRAALDYLVYELACFDSQSIVEKTQFVIVDSEQDFRKNMWHLRGLTGEHIAMFERLQPYEGCNWTKLLRDISNPDKHRQLTAVKHPVYIRIDPSNTESILAGKDVNVNSYASIQITFRNGPPVIESLEQLVLEVAHVLDIFKPEFQR